MRKALRKTIAVRQIIIWAIVLTFALSGAVISYAENYYELRNADIPLELPDDWECDEIDEELTDDMDCEQIAVAHDNSGKSELAMDMYYSDDDEEVIHKMLRFYNADGAAVTESETGVISSIVNNFYDNGYGDDSEPYYNDDDYDSDTDVFGAIMGFIVLVIPLVIIVKVVNKKKNAFEAPARSSRSRSKDDFSAGFRKKRSDFEKEKYRRTDDNVKPNEHPHDHIKPSNAEERYMESLRTLRKSGLLTKEEMQDMLERHERNKMYKS